VDFLCLFGIRNTPVREARVSHFLLHQSVGCFLGSLKVANNIPEGDICHAQRVMDGTGALFPHAR